ncbi:Uncharacterized protein PCOAH_00002440 [Plasmodium coatneyi]|uniref:Uncharacterized protein n=1 Tax=Plasmodium coatneyi TaxID=208452 RepID=A0A1B1DT63_9APIC|nr:Uncharacterized protein PCOAH_00002440 [Plasmodium coatneyi]ANQ05934.1 Uncharacterized protein PCOAH_00002440 [Plasmodium coatneyi]
MGRDIREFYNLRNRYLDKRKETNLNILKSTRNKITCNNDVAVTNAPAHLRENKYECNNNAATSANKVKAQRKTTGLRKNHESAEHTGRHKDRTKQKGEEKGSDKIGKMSRVIKIAKIDKGDKSDVNDANEANHANRAKNGPDRPINRKTYHKGKKCQLHKSKECKDDHDVDCDNQHTGECEIIANTNEADTCSGSGAYVANSKNPSAYHQNGNKFSSHSGCTSNKANVHLVGKEKKNNLKIINVNNSEIKNMYDVLDTNRSSISCTINSNGASTSNIIQSNYRRKCEQQNDSHVTSNICDSTNDDEEVTDATIKCDTVNAKNDDHTKGSNSYYGEKCDYEVVKNIWEDGGTQNSNEVSVNTCGKSFTNQSHNILEDEHKSNVTLTERLSSKNSEQRERRNGTSNCGSEDHSTNYRTHNRNDAGDAYSSRRNNGNNDNHYGHNCNRNRNAKNGSGGHDRNGNDDNKNDRGDDKNANDDDRNASDDDKKDSDDEKNESEDDKNESDHDHNEFHAEGRPHRDSFKIPHKAVYPDYPEEQIQQSKFYSKEAEHEEVSNLYKEMLAKHMNSSGYSLKQLHVQKNERENNPNNTYLVQDSYVRSDDITLPINNFLGKKETYNWNKGHYELFNSLNDIICEVKKKSNLFVNNYKNKEMVIQNNNNAVRSKIDSTFLNSINRNGNFTNAMHLPTYVDSNMRKKPSEEYVNNNLYKHQLDRNSALNIKHTSHLGPRSSNAYHPEMGDSSGYGCNSFRSNHTDHITANNTTCSEYDCDKQPFRNNRNPIECSKISNIKMYPMGTENIHVGNSTNKPTLQCDENFKTTRTDPLEYNSHFLHKNKINETCYSKQVLLKNVGNNVDSKIVQMKKNENIKSHTEPVNEHAKTKDIYVQENPNSKNSLINKDMYNNFKGTEKSNVPTYAQHNKGSSTPFDSSLMNSYFYLKKELKEVDDMSTSISNGIKANGQWAQKRNLPTSSPTGLPTSLPTEDVESRQTDTRYSNTRSSSLQPMSHHHEVNKASRNNTEKEVDRKMVTKGYLNRNHNSLQYNKIADNHIVLEDSMEDITCEIEHANEEMTHNKSSDKNSMINANPLFTKCYTEKNNYEYIEDDNSVYSVNNDQVDQKVPHLIINPDHGMSDKMDGVNYTPACTLSGGDPLNKNDAHGFLHNGENENEVCTVEDDDVVEVIPSEVEITRATLPADNYSQQSGDHIYNRGNKEGNSERGNCERCNCERGNCERGNCEIGNCSDKENHTSCIELPSSNKTLGSNYLTRSKSIQDVQYNHSDQSVDSIYDRRRSRLYEYDSVIGRNKLRKEGRPKLIQKETKKKREMRSLNGVDVNYSVEGTKLGSGEWRNKDFKLRNKNITPISNANGKRNESIKINCGDHDLCNQNRDPFIYEKMEDDPIDITNEEFRHSKISSGKITYEKGNINTYRQRMAAADKEGNNLCSIDYYRNYNSVQCVKEDLLKKEKFPFIFYDSHIRNLVIYYKDNCSDEIKCKYFSAQRFGHATAKKIALNFLRSLGINPDHLENNNVFSYEKDSKSKLFNVERGKTYIDKEENSNINLIYDSKKRNVIVSWINKVKGYNFRKFSTQRFGFDVALSLSIDFYKNLGGQKEEEEIRNYINKVNSNFKSIRILTNKKKKRNLKGKIIDITNEFMDPYSNNYENVYDNTSLSYFYFSNMKYNIENLKNNSMQKGTSANTQMNKYTNLFYITDQFYQIFECKLKNLHMEQVKMTKVYKYDFFLNKTFYFLYLKYLENVKSALYDENGHNLATMCEQIKSCKTHTPCKPSKQCTVQSHHKVQRATDEQQPSDPPTNYFQLVDLYCDSDIHRNCTNGNINYFISKMDYYRGEDILMKGYYSADDTKLYDIFFLSSGRKGGLEEETLLADLNSNTYNDKMYHQSIYHKKLYKNQDHHSQLYPGGLCTAQKTSRRTTRNKNAERGNPFQDYHIHYSTGNEHGIGHGSNCNCDSNNCGDVNSSSSGNERKNSYSDFDNTDDEDVCVCNEKRKGTRRRISKHRKWSRTKGKPKHNTMSEGNSIMSTKKSESFYEDQEEDDDHDDDEGEMLLDQVSSYRKSGKKANKMRNISTGRGKSKGVHKGASKKTGKGSNKQMHKRTLKKASKGVTKGGTRGINRGNHKKQHNMNFLKNKKFLSTNKNISNLLTKGRKYIICYNYMGKIQVKVFSADIYGSMTAQRKAVAFLQQIRREIKSEGKILYSESDSKTAHDVTSSLMESALLNPCHQDNSALKNNIQCEDHPHLVNNTVVKNRRGRKRKKREDAVEELLEMAAALQAQQQQMYQRSDLGAWECARGKTTFGKGSENKLNSQLNAQLISQISAQVSDEKAPAKKYQNRKLSDSADYQKVHNFYENEDNNENVSMFRMEDCEDKIVNPNDLISISESLMKTYSLDEKLHRALDTQDEEYKKGNFGEPIKRNSKRSDLPLNEYINNTTGEEGKYFDHNNRAPSLSFTKRYSDATQYEIGIPLSNKRDHLNSTIRSESENEDGKDLSLINKNEQFTLHLGKDETQNSSNVGITKHINLRSDKKISIEDPQKGKINELNCVNKLTSEQKVVKGYLTLRKEKTITPNVKRVYSLYDLYNKIINECDYADFLSQNSARKILKNGKGNLNDSPSDDPNDDPNDDPSDDPNDDPLEDFSPYKKRIIMRSGKTERMNRNHMPRTRRTSDRLANNQVANKSECRDDVSSPMGKEAKKERGTATRSDPRKDAEMENILKSAETLSTRNPACSPRNFKNDWSGLVKYNTAKGVIKIPKICVHKLARKKGFAKLTCIIYRGKGEFVSYFLERSNKKINDSNAVQNENKEDKSTESKMPFKINKKNGCAKLNTYQCSTRKNAAKKQTTQSNRKYNLREKQSNPL